MKILKISLNINPKSFLENKVALFGGRYLHFRKTNHKAEDIWAKIAIFIIHIIGIFSLLYLKFMAFILSIVYRLSSGKTRERLDRWMDGRS